MAQDTRDSRLNPWASEQSAIRSKQLVNTTCPRTLARVNRDMWSNTQAFGPSPSLWSACRPRGTSDQITSRPGQMVQAAGHRTRARIIWDSWWTPQELEQMHESSGTAGRPRRTAGPGLSRPGQLVDPTGIKTCSRIARETWSTPRPLGSRFDSPGISEQPCGLRTEPESPGIDG